MAFRTDGRLPNPHKLYLLIDEYDNFANDVLMAGRKQAYYEALLYGEGLLKTVFKAVKAAAGGQGWIGRSSPAFRRSSSAT